MGMSRYFFCVVMSVAVGATLLLGVGGCEVTRYGQLTKKADRVESDLKKEQAKALTLTPGDPARAAKLEHLTSLRNQLSAANVGLSAVKYVVPPEQRNVGYDVIEQVYDTIDWNIPLSASDPGKKMMPSQFSDGVLKLSQ